MVRPSAGALIVLILPFCFQLSPAQQDSTGSTVRSVLLQDGTRVTGTVVEEDSVFLRLKTAEGMTVKVAKSQLVGSNAEAGAPIPAGKMMKLELTDGTEFSGTVVSETPASVEFRTTGGLVVQVPREQVKELKPEEGEMVEGTFFRRDPNKTRLFFAPTARPLPSGKGYFAAYEIFFPMLAVGIGDIVTLAGGMSLLPGADGQLFYIAPKITPINTENFSLAAGVLYGTGSWEDMEGAGIYYGVGTLGNDRSSVTFGLGWGFYGDETADKPIIMLGGEFQISRSAKILSENWIVPNSDVQLISFGVRFFGENLAADFGLFHPLGADMGGFPFFPWIGFAYNF